MRFKCYFCKSNCLPQGCDELQPIMEYPVESDPFRTQHWQPPREICGWTNHFSCSHVFNTQQTYAGDFVSKYEKNVEDKMEKKSLIRRLLRL